MTKIVTSLILSLLFCVSCTNKYGVTFYVTNAREVDLSHIELFPSPEPLVINNLKPGITKEVFMDFSDAARVDGSYEIRLNKKSDSLSRYGFGYYSNGSPQEKEIRIVIYNDSFSIKHIYKEY